MDKTTLLKKLMGQKIADINFNKENDEITITTDTGDSLEVVATMTGGINVIASVRVTQSLNHD